MEEKKSIFLLVIFYECIKLYSLFLLFLLILVVQDNKNHSM